MRRFSLTGVGITWCVCILLGLSCSNAADGTKEEAIQELRKMTMETELVPEESPQATEELFRKSEEWLRKMEEEKSNAVKEGREAKFPDSTIEKQRKLIVLRRERTSEQGKARAESLLEADLKRYREEFEKIYDIPHTSMNPEEVEKAWVQDLWYQVDYQKRLRKFPDSDGNSLLEIRGRVIDQEGNPVPDAKLVFDLNFVKARDITPHDKKISVKTDKKGVYRIEGERGEDLSLEDIAAPGYQYIPRGQKVRSFRGQSSRGKLDMQKILSGETPAGNYAEFVLWKKMGRTEKVVMRGAGKDGRKSLGAFGHYGRLKMGDKAYAYDLLKDWCDWNVFKPFPHSPQEQLEKQEMTKAWTKHPFHETELSATGDARPDPKEYEGKGDFICQIFESPTQPTSPDEPRQAILRITAIDGGVVKNPSRGFLAPDEGYQPFVDFPINLTNPVRVHFFLKSRGGQVYSALEAFLDILPTGQTWEFIWQFSGIVSPTGSRVLEPEGPIYTEKEVIALFQQDWKQVKKGDGSQNKP
jgi:hypothetical protein